MSSSADPSVSPAPQWAWTFDCGHTTISGNDHPPDACPACGETSLRRKTPAAVSPAEPPEEFRELPRDFPDLIERLRGRAMLAKANGQGITMALCAEAAAAIEELCEALSEDRQLRWRLRARLDAALMKADRDA